MLWTIDYGGRPLHDPRQGEVALSASLSEEMGRSATLTMRLPATSAHALEVAPMDARREVVATCDGEVQFMGRATRVETALDGTATIECEGARAYLNDTVLRPYANYRAQDFHGEPDAPTDAGDLFRWMVAEHNARCGDLAHRFAVGEVAGDGVELLRSSTQWPTTLSEIQSKLVDGWGGQVEVSYGRDERKTLNWHRDGSCRAAQRVEFGSNLMEFAVASGSTDVVTAVAPTWRMDGQDADATLSGVRADDVSLPDGFRLVGDEVRHDGGCSSHGVICERRSYDVSSAQAAVEAACSDLVRSALGVESVDVTALDLAAIDPSVRPIRLLEWVDVSARPLGFSARMMCVSRDVDLLDPSRTRYGLGATRKTLTNGLTASETHIQALEEATSVSVAALTDAQRKHATELEEVRATAVTGQREQWALAETRVEAPTSGWSDDAPGVDGGVLWRRLVTTTADGATETGPAVPVTGPQGDRGADGQDGTGVTVSSVGRENGATKVGLRDASGTTEISIPDGATGPQGPQGPRGATGVDGRMLVAASATPAAVAAKAATLRAGTLTLAAGASVTVVFDEANVAGHPTLDVGGTGARPMMTNGAPYAYWVAGTAVSLVFDGSIWQVCSVPVYASEATVGNPAAGNVLVGADSVDVRDGTAVLASFGARLVELGRNATDAIVRMCGGRAWVSYDDTSGAASLRGASAVLVGAPRLAELSAQGAGAGRYAHAVCDDSDGTAGVLLAAGDGAGHSASLALNGSEGTLSLRAPVGVSVNGSAVDLSDTGWVPVYASADGRYFVRWRARRGVCYLLWDQTGVGQGGWYAPDPIPREYLPEAAMYLPSAVYGANSTGSVWVPARSDPGGRPWLSCYDASARLVGSASWPYAAAR